MNGRDSSSTRPPRRSGISLAFASHSRAQGSPTGNSRRSREAAETESLADTLVEENALAGHGDGYTTGRGGLGNYHPHPAPASIPVPCRHSPQPPPLEEPVPEFPWPRGRDRTQRRGRGNAPFSSASTTGRGGYGNIAHGTTTHHQLEWAYSERERELLDAHIARRIAIPSPGRGGYGNISFARSLQQQAVTEQAARSRSIDPVAAPVGVRFGVPAHILGMRRDRRRPSRSPPDRENDGHWRGSREA